jgi:hypothetical protein
MEEIKIYSELYCKQAKSLQLNQVFSPLLPTVFNFTSMFSHNETQFVDFIDQGPTSDFEFPHFLIQKEFDPSMTSNLDFSNPECFKANICPLGVQEFKFLVHYQLMVLQ